MAALETDVFGSERKRNQITVLTVNGMGEIREPVWFLHRQYIQASGSLLHLQEMMQRKLPQITY